jgi:hypothetical protein
MGRHKHGGSSGSDPTSLSSDQPDRSEVRLPALHDLLYLVGIGVDPASDVDGGEPLSHQLGRGPGPAVQA